MTTAYTPSEVVRQRQEAIQHKIAYYEGVLTDGPAKESR
jgi:hypothetical protein